MAAERYLILTAEHGMNASTFTARVIASTGADDGGGAGGRRGRALGSAARRRAVAGARHAGRDRHRRARRGLDRATRSPTGGASWASGTGSTAPRTRAPRACARRPRRSARRALALARAVEREALAQLRAAEARPRAGDQRRVLVGGRARGAQASRASCSRRRSPSRARSAGRPTSWSRCATTASSGRGRSYVGPAVERTANPRGPDAASHPGRAHRLRGTSPDGGSRPARRACRRRRHAHAEPPRGAERAVARAAGALCEAFVELPQAGEVERASILTGAGRAFCAGLDLKELGGESSARRGRRRGGRRRGREPASMRMAACPLPIIGAINGFAITGGFELALGLRRADRVDARRASPTRTRASASCRAGASARSCRASIGIYRAKELSLTGNYLGGRAGGGAGDW